MKKTRASVLVVDDDVDTCRNLADILEDLGYAVTTACDGESALAEIEQRPYDLALLDFKMPGMDGLELYRQIKQLRPETVAIIISAYAGEETAERARKGGAWTVLAKPVDLSRLLPLLDEALRQPQVLVVDDDADLCATLWDILRDQGYRVSLAHSESEALRQIGEHAPSVVLLDMRLADGNGHSIFRQLRSADPQPHVVLITGFRREFETLVEQVLAEGADAVCYKPFDVARLLETVRRLSSNDQDTP